MSAVDPLVLALDATGDPLAAMVWASGQARGAASAVSERGRSDAIIAVAEQAMSAANLPFDALDRIAVVTGPGSFTGVRVGVAAARGFALAVGKPAIGVDGFEALAAQTGAEDGPVVGVFGRAPRFLWRVVSDGAAGGVGDGAAMSAAVVAAGARLVVGPAAEAASGARCAIRPMTVDLKTVAALAAARRLDDSRPTPLYLRAPDATPSHTPPPPRLGQDGS